VAAEQEEKAIAGLSPITPKDQSSYEEVTRAVTQLAVRRSVYERMLAEFTDWAEKLRLVESAAPVWEPWPDEGGADSRQALQQGFSTAAAQLRRAVKAIEDLVAGLAALLESEHQRQLHLDQAARSHRRLLEQAQAGRGALAKRVADLRTQSKRLAALTQLRDSKVKRVQDLRGTRGLELDELDASRTHRYEERKRVASILNNRLAPQIRIDVTQFGTQSEYASILAGALRGSGLHYGTLAPALAARMSPRELVEAVELGDAETVARVGDIPLDRAQRLVAHLASNGLSSLLTVPVEDSVQFSLLDGAEYKSTGSLSTGQRCTVMLPILLSHDGRTLIIDQPEDHLDNAFVVDTLIHAILLRQPGSQLVLATHNANIPVLGDAARVFVLDSDGKRGFIRNAGPLSDPRIVDAITTIMEGGREAFERRAAFYRASRD
jgi:hypothetical protein